MKLFSTRFCFFIGKTCAIFALCLLTGPAVSTAALQAGSGKVEITPAAGTPLSGYGKLRGKPSSGVHDPIFARAAALSHDGETFVILSLDLCLIDRELRDAVYKQITARYPLKEENFLLTATHTHTGAGAIGGRFWQKFIMGSFDRSVFEKLVSQASEAALTALNTREDVSAEYGSVEINDLIENRMIPKLRYPQQLQIIRFPTAAGKIKGQLVFMAAHPTLFPAKDRLQFSADYPGLFTAALDEIHPESAAVFVNGAAGDLRPHTPEAETKLERMQLFSQALVEKAGSMDYTALNLQGPWHAVLLEEKLPRVQVRAGWFKVPSIIGNRFFPRRTFFQGLRAGPLMILAVPGELSSELGYEAANRVLRAGFRPLIAGYANDYVGYIIPRRYYGDRDQYEARVSFYGREFDLFLQEKLTAVLDRLLLPEERAAFESPGRLSDNGGLPVLRLSGSAYHQGFEEGRLFKNEIRTGLDQIFGYFRSELKVPVINRLIIYWTASRAWKKQEPYLNYDELQQIKGIAAGAEIPLRTMQHLHAMPELFPTLCTNGAYWGEATQDTNLIAIRNLDWNRDMRIFDLAAVKYHEGGRLPSYTNIGYTGFSGVLSGMNDRGISIGEIGADSADATLSGLAMVFLQKRILETAESLSDAEAVFRRSDLTQGYNYVIADAEAKEAVVVEATRSHLAFFRDDDPKEAEVDYAFRLKHAVFRGDPALDPAIRDLQWASKGNPEKPGPEEPRGSAYEVRYLKHGKNVAENFGRITPATAQAIARDIAPGSNIQSVIYHYPYFDVANAEGEKRAVDTAYHRFDMREFSREA